MSARFQAPSPPYLGPARFHGGPQNLKPIKRVVIHCTVSPTVNGGARAIASYFKHTVTRPSSAHYVVDPGEVVQVVGDHQIAYHAPPNTDSIGVELCDLVAGAKSRWSDRNHSMMLGRAAELVARLCLAYDLPVRRIGPIRLRLGQRGICGHSDVSKAWKQTSHTDPGDGFPWPLFMNLVRREVARLKAGGAQAPVTPIPATPPKTPVVPSMGIVTSNIKNLPDLSREQVRHDTLAVSKLGGVVLWQEIAEADDRNDLLTSCPPLKWTHVGLDTEVPMSFRSSEWEVRGSGKVLLHHGKVKVSPNRYVTWAEVARKGSSVGSLIVMNTHYVSGGYSNPGQLAEDWRREMWAKSHAAQRVLVQGWLDKGKTCIGGGDFNRPGVWPGFATGHRWLMHGGYDHLWVCEAPTGVRVRLEQTGTLDLKQLFTDHPARWAHVTLLAPSK